MTPHFATALVLELIGPSRWRLTTPLRYQSVVASAEIVVPQDFITDLASVPRRPLAYLITGGRAPAPAVVHDLLYQRPDFHDRALADAVLYEAMGVNQPEMGLPEPGYVRWLMWAAVRLAGWRAWKDTARAERLNPVWSTTGWPDAP